MAQPGQAPVPGGAGGGPLWITSAHATMAGKTEKASFLGVVTTRASATLRSQLKLKAGLVVDSVEPKSPATTAGLIVHDILEKCDDQWLINPAQFVSLIRMYKPGETVTFTVLREGERKKISAKLEERETYAVSDDGEANVFYYAQPTANQPNNSQGPVWAYIDRNAGPGGPVQRITTRALGAAPLAPGFVATFGDDKLQLVITIHDGHQVLIAKDTSGKEIFQGPIDTPEQLKLVPENVRKKFEEMDRINTRIRSRNGAGPQSDPETAPAP
jgi:hypothetical protein